MTEGRETQGMCGEFFSSWDLVMEACLAALQSSGSKVPGHMCETDVCSMAWLSLQ